MKTTLKKMRRLIILIIFALLLAGISGSIITYGSCGNEFVRPDLIPTIESIAAQYGVSPELIEAMIETESQGISSVSNGSCIGLMQVSTRWHADRAQRLGVDLHTDEGNIAAGVDYLMELAEESDDLYYVLATYNGQSDAAEGKANGYADKILERAEELEYVHGKRAYESKRDIGRQDKSGKV